jgi:hypothetical protein
MSLIAELKRRNVFRVALLYLVAGWVILQVAQLLFDVLKLPDWTSRLVLGLLMLGFPLALIFSWVYELTPEGLKREHEVDRNQSITAGTARKLDMVVGALQVADRHARIRPLRRPRKHRRRDCRVAHVDAVRAVAPPRGRTDPRRSPCCASST